MFCYLDSENYHRKCNYILSDSSKFKHITRNPIETVKDKLNKLISVINAQVDGVKFEKVIGVFNPDYFYGSVKTHKESYPLRPIISQIPNPTYRVDMKLHNVIFPYISNTYFLRYTEEFIDIMRVNKPKGFIVSLDTESLFTHITRIRTIGIILQYVYVYHHPELPPPPPNSQEYFEGNAVYLYNRGPVQVPKREAVQTAYLSSELKPRFYCRYNIDDIFVCKHSSKLLEGLRLRLQEISGLKFTTEININGKLLFLDVLVDSASTNFTTSVYRKPTNTDNCMNDNNECSDNYKKGVIRAYVRRAIKLCSSWETLHAKFQHLRQMIINNSYVNYDFDDITNKLMSELNSSQCSIKPHFINIFCRNTITDSYKK
ncbi:uncharacterized protein LOC143021169 [Oratosquilla oratoria]|uniref:uncharacterized protein LOC143021169 n=1 Tax=Oratosquilla oratoria TaxID=337810 RepID=UPI003F76CEC8